MKLNILSFILIFKIISNNEKYMCPNKSNIKSPIDLQLSLKYFPFKVNTKFNNNIKTEIIKIKENHLRILGDFGFVDYSKDKKNKKFENYKINDLNLYTPSLHAFLGSKFLFELHINAKNKENKLLTIVILFQEKNNGNYHSNFLNLLGFKTGKLKNLNIGKSLKIDDKLNLKDYYGKNKFFINYIGNRPESNLDSKENCTKNEYLFSVNTIYVDNSYIEELGLKDQIFSYKSTKNMIIKQNKNKPKPKKNKKKLEKTPNKKESKKKIKEESNKNSKKKNPKKKLPKKEKPVKISKNTKEKLKEKLDDKNKEKEKDKQLKKIEEKKLKKKENPKIVYANTPKNKNNDNKKQIVYVYIPKNKKKMLPKKIYIKNPSNDNKTKLKYPSAITINTKPPSNYKIDLNSNKFNLDKMPQIVYLNNPPLKNQNEPNIVFLNKPLYTSKNSNNIQIVYFNNPGFISSKNPRIIYLMKPKPKKNDLKKILKNSEKIKKFSPLKLNSGNIHKIRNLNLKKNIVWNENNGFYPPNAILYWYTNFKDIIKKFEPFPKPTLLYKYIPYYIFPFKNTNYFVPVYIKVKLNYKYSYKKPKKINFYINSVRKNKQFLNKVKVKPIKNFKISKELNNKVLKILNIKKNKPNNKKIKKDVKLMVNSKGEFKIIKVCKKMVMGLLLNRYFIHKKQWNKKVKDLYDFNRCRKFKRIKIPIENYKELENKLKNGTYENLKNNKKFSKNHKILCNMNLQIILNVNKRNKNFIKDYVNKICKLYKNKEWITMKNKIETVENFVNKNIKNIEK